MVPFLFAFYDIDPKTSPDHYLGRVLQTPLLAILFDFSPLLLKIMVYLHIIIAVESFCSHDKSNIKTSNSVGVHQLGVSK